MATLYLHIGMPKTGTKAIQLFCVANKTALERQGYCYPLFRWKYKKANRLHNGIFLQQKQSNNLLWRMYMDYVIRLLTKYPNVILSDEELWRLTKLYPSIILDSLKAEAVRHSFDLKVIVYLRRQDQWLNSQWAQYIRENNPVIRNQSFSDFLSWADEYWSLDYYEQLKKIADIVGKKNLIVRVYDRIEFIEGDVVQDFLAILGISMDDNFIIAEENPNASQIDNILEIRRIINSLPDLSDKFREQLYSIARNCSRLEAEAGKYSMFSEAEAKALLEKYEASNR